MSGSRPTSRYQRLCAVLSTIAQPSAPLAAREAPALAVLHTVWQTHASSATRTARCAGAAAPSCPRLANASSRLAIRKCITAPKRGPEWSGTQGASDRIQCTLRLEHHEAVPLRGGRPARRTHAGTAQIVATQVGTSQCAKRVVAVCRPYLDLDPACLDLLRLRRCSHPSEISHPIWGT